MDLPEKFKDLKIRLRNLSSSWQALTFNQKISFAFFLFFILILPLSVLVTSIPVRLYKRAAMPATPPITPFTTPSPTPTTFIPEVISPVIGEQKVLIIMYNFQDQPENKPFTENQVFSAFFAETESVNSYYKEYSFNKLWLTGKVVGWYTIPFNSTCSWNEQMRETLLARTRDSGVNPDNHQHLIYLSPYVEACSSTASIGGKPSEMFLHGTISLWTLVHETGHNLTLGYAASLSCGNKSIDHYSNCQKDYYGDPFSPQGSTNLFHQNAFAKSSLGWISPESIREITKSGEYSISPIEKEGTGIQVLKIRKPDTQEYYFLEYRSRTGADSTLPQQAVSGALLHVGFYETTYKTPYLEKIQISEYGINTLLIDTNPETPNSFGDAPLKDGGTFRDDINNITITQTRHDNDSVTLFVSLPSSPTPTSAPTLTPPPPITPIVHCIPSQEGIFSVLEYTRSDNSPGLKITVYSRIKYKSVALKFTQQGSTDGYFVTPSSEPFYSPSTGYHAWTWDVVRPANPNYKIEFYVNYIPSLLSIQNGEPCGEWYSYPTPSLFPTTPPPIPISPRLTPTPHCWIALKEYFVNTACDGGFRYATYICTDGYRGQMGGPTSCKSTELWKQYASSACSSRCLPITTVKPILSPSPTPTAHYLPTPTSAINYQPVITTRSLPFARLGSNYQANITGRDIGNDGLRMSISGLPAGLSQGPCVVTTPEGSKQISCTISGRPLKTGRFPITITLQDNRGGMTQKILTLTVYKRFFFF